MEINKPPYKVIAKYGIAEFVERRSRFIGRVWPVSSEEEALLHLKEVRALHRDATHNVYGYRLKENSIMRYSDDGEPSQTAGLPLLEAFLRQDIYNFVCVATRYFGGILLGAGGLVRAYAQTGKIALEQGGVAVVRVWADAVISCTYTLFETMKRLLNEFEAVVSDIVFSVDVDIYFSLAAEKWDLLSERIIDISSGTIEPLLLKSDYRSLIQ